MLTHWRKNTLQPLFEKIKLAFLKVSHNALYIILAIGLIQGLLYVFLTPPWWHNDEPGHFEFAWQIVHFDHWPKKGEFDESMRRQMAASMLEYNWYDVVNYHPDFSSERPIKTDLVGAQTTQYPLYYILASLPLRLLGAADFAVQNYAMRLVSLIMFLLTLYAVWNAVGELVSKSHPAQWMIPLFMALLPGFADTMTSISDDVGAVLALSLFLWASLRLIQRGYSWFNLAALMLSLTACYWMKNTAWSALLLTPLVLMMAAFRKRLRWLPIALTGLAFLTVVLYAFSWDEASQWYRPQAQSQPSRYPVTQAPWGQYALRIEKAGTSNNTITQPITNEQIIPLREKTVTFGAWMWADRATKISFPRLEYALYPNKTGNSPRKLAILTNTPTFYSLTFKIPYAAEKAWVVLMPFTAPDHKNVEVYYDGIVLTEGQYLQGQPHFQSADAISGTWNGTTIQNLIRNGSAEDSWMRMKPNLSAGLKPLFPYGSLDTFLVSLSDGAGTGWYYRGVAGQLFNTFWGKTARVKVSLLGSDHTYGLLRAISLLAAIGAFHFLWRKRRRIPWRIVFFLGLVLMITLGAAVARFGTTAIDGEPAYPWARYIFPAILPTAWLLCIGLWEGLRLLGVWIKKLSAWHQGAIFVVFLISVDMFALLSLTKYFYLKSGQEYTLLFIILIALLIQFTFSFIYPRLKHEAAAPPKN